MDDERDDHEDENAAGHEPEGLMPLSMPPMGALPPSEPVTVPLAVAPAEPPTDELEALTTEELPAAAPPPLPLSVPPPSPPVEPAAPAPPTPSIATSWVPSPPPPPPSGAGPAGSSGGGWGAAPPGALPPPPPYPYLGGIATPAPPGPPPRRRGRAVAALVLVAVLAGALGAGLGVAFAPPAPAPESSPPFTPPPSSVPAAPNTTVPSGSVQAIAAKVEPAVVDINTVLAGTTPTPAAGTGIIISAGGEVLTNNHVVEQAQSINVVVPNHGTHRASVIGVDDTRDVALLQIEGLSGSLPHADLGDSSSVQVGEQVIAIGNAYGYEGTPTPAPGTVTALNRTIMASDEVSSTDEETLHGVFQINAQIVPGDSGGPLLDYSGQVIGMDTAAQTSDGGAAVGFAIPINEALQLALDMRGGRSVDGIVLGESAFLGIDYTNPNSQAQPSPFGTSPTSSGAGVQVSGVVPSGPASSAGIVPGDVVTALGGAKTLSPSALGEALSKYRPGQHVQVSFLDTSGASHTTTVTLGAIPR